MSDIGICPKCKQIRKIIMDILEMEIYCTVCATRINQKDTTLEF